MDGTFLDRIHQVLTMPEDFVIARNTEPGSTLPCLIRIPLGDGIVLKAKDT